MKIIENCRKNQSEDEVFRVMRRGGLRVRLAVRNSLADSGLRGQELRNAVNDVMDDLNNATDEEIKSTIKNCACN